LAYHTASDVRRSPMFIGHYTAAIGLSLAKTRSRWMNPGMLIGGAEHGCHRIDHYVARATELDMGAGRRRGPATRSSREPARSLRGGGRVRRLRLRRATDVAMMEAADLGQRNDAAVLGWLDGARLRRILLEGEVGA
jgi:hypothetical protein